MSGKRRPSSPESRLLPLRRHAEAEAGADLSDDDEGAGVGAEPGAAAAAAGGRPSPLPALQPSPAASPAPSGSKKKKPAPGHAPSPATPATDPELAQHRPRNRREPLPMKLRALPQSFWQQPNAACGLSPGAVYPVLPPLCCKDDDDAGLRPATPPEDREQRRVVSVANTELLFSLFRGVEQHEQPAARVARRGRPKKVAAASWRVSREEDPCLVSALADPILPLIRGHAGQNHQVLATVSLGAGERSVVLPSLSVEHNYSQILSELVMKL